MAWKQKFITIQLSELDVKILLEALGHKQTRYAESGISTKAIRILVDRIYRAMGVRL